jgi:hypothetical protein
MTFWMLLVGLKLIGLAIGAAVFTIATIAALASGTGKPTRLAVFTCIWMAVVLVGFAIVAALNAGG